MTEKNMTTVILIRHGECEGNREGLFRGRTDFPLNEAGRKQARSLAEAIKPMTPSIVYSSPLLRAEETARIISEGCGAELALRQGFINIALGRWENRKKADIQQEYPEEWRLWLSHPERLRMAGGETLGDVRRRAFANLDVLVKGHAGGVFAIVSHRAVLKPLLAEVLDIGDPYFWKVHLDTASFSILRHEKDRGYCLTTLNQTYHLGRFISEWV